MQPLDVSSGTAPFGDDFRLSCCSLGCLLVGFWDFSFLGFYRLHDIGATRLAYERGSEVSQPGLYMRNPFCLASISGWLPVFGGALALSEASL